MTRRAGRLLLVHVVTLCILGAVLLSRLAAPLAVSGDELRYSLGTVQQQRELTVAAGGSATTTLAFYNIDGNVPTVVELSVVDVPSGWSVTLSRPDGAHGATSLSLDVHPSTPRPDAPQVRGEDCEAVLLPPRGYVCVDPVTVTVQTPGNVRPDTRSTVRLVATATWSVDGTAAPFPQEREFVFDVVITDTTARQTAATASPTSTARPLLVAVLLVGIAAWALRRLLVKSRMVA